MTGHVYNGVPHSYNELKNAYASDVVAHDFTGFAKEEEAAETPKAAVEKANALHRGVGKEDGGCSRRTAGAAGAGGCAAEGDARETGTAEEPQENSRHRA